MPTLSEILNKQFPTSGLSKSYLATQLEVSEKTIENYINGKREPELEKVIKLSTILGFQLNELSEQNVPKTNNIPLVNNKSKGDKDYVALLESNDKFFKHEYAQMMLSLKELIALCRKQEALIKLNLQHTGAVEALQKGVEPEVVQEQINNQIADIEPYEEMDIDADSQDKP
jgi:transcriptional regulator with XRE-family HTH domain